MQDGLAPDHAVVALSGPATPAGVALLIVDPPGLARRRPGPDAAPVLLVVTADEVREARGHSWSAADDHKSPVVLANKLVASEAFTAVAIQHKLLVLGKYCDNGLAHKVDLVVSTAAKPDASPTATESFSMAKAATTMYPRTITNTLTTPLTVAKGGHVFVLVDLATDAVAGMRLCLRSDGSTKSMERFVSDGPTAPFTWTSITGVPPQVSLLGF